MGSKLATLFPTHLEVVLARPPRLVAAAVEWWQRVIQLHKFLPALS